jgi:hypothetical protein
VNTAIPTFSQIKAQISAIRQKIPKARVFGIHAPGRWTGEREKRDGNQVYVIYQCDSPLAMRVALREQADATAFKVLVTNLEEKDLSEDIRLRLAKRRLYPIDSWQIVKSLFQARTVDPRLTRHPWIADMLMDLIPEEGHSMARGGFLDGETVWPLLLSRLVTFTAETPDLTSLLKWSIDGDAVERFRTAEERFRFAAIDWLKERTGPAGEVILQCVERFERPDALPLGLAMGVIFDPAVAGNLERAAGKLEERYLAGKPPDPGLMLRWSAAATEVIRLQITDPKVRAKQLQRADEILREVQAEGFAYLSSTSPLGFDQRLGKLGQELALVLEHRKWEMLEDLRHAQKAVRDHDQAGREPPHRLERTEMAMRLLRWLAERDRGDRTEPQSLAQAAVEHLRDGGFVDWARFTLYAGDPVREMSEAYARLLEEVTKIREQQSRDFAQLLRDWTAAGSPSEEVIPVERILEQIVAPLAAKAPVLLIVIDGMSIAVCRELLPDLTRDEWVSLCEPGRPFTRPGIATIPSVTETSRTSLLCGRLAQGSSGDEQNGFGAHPALLSHSRSEYPPILFHKPALQESGDAVLATEVRNEIGSSHRRIVGVVVNAVDDNLLKGEQIEVRWSRDAIKVLPALLHEARNAGRLVVLVSDHGHVLDHQTQGRSYEEGERWRIDDGRPAGDEVQVQGSRVVTAGSRLIGPWSEKIRYGSKRSGYHGGLNPQEIVVPVVVLGGIEAAPVGWNEMSLETPSWWDEPAVVVTPAGQLLPRLKPAEPPHSRTLFDLKLDREKTPQVAEGGELSEWISRLLSSPVYTEQKRLGGRAVPPDDFIGKFLALLDRRGGKMTMAALARSLDYSLPRLRGLLAVLQRVLNVDGYSVLSRDEVSDSVELNRELLLKQFDLV